VTPCSVVVRLRGYVKHYNDWHFCLTVDFCWPSNEVNYIRLMSAVASKHDCAIALVSCALSKPFASPFIGIVTSITILKVSYN
jgi:hypothetical protein